MITFKAKIKDSKIWFDGTSLIKHDENYIIMKGDMEWVSNTKWDSADNDWDVIDISTLIIETKEGNK
jgi:hypothetical protein